MYGRREDRVSYLCPFIYAQVTSSPTKGSSVASTAILWAIRTKTYQARLSVDVVPQTRHDIVKLSLERTEVPANARKVCIPFGLPPCLSLCIHSPTSFGATRWRPLGRILQVERGSRRGSHICTDRHDLPLGAPLSGCEGPTIPRWFVRLASCAHRAGIVLGSFVAGDTAADRCIPRMRCEREREWGGGALREVPNNARSQISVIFLTACFKHPISVLLINH